MIINNDENCNHVLFVNENEFTLTKLVDEQRRHLTPCFTEKKCITKYVKKSAK